MTMKKRKRMTKRMMNIRAAMTIVSSVLNVFARFHRARLELGDEGRA
jgi:hypothetical protein